ncbi:hypothetical protein QBC37DRAFT_83604 [Rhypophila decipiens]|uniref:CENP-V/GFA domain-containing protein n=1 Tax=Rhypophila decipiens TaxID=261697 RepID=A0AAN6YHA1_9PEZI|nr:hypothetical protein QBC37DRAFT_83604 [Rhypophila decipiens]
MSLLRPLHGGCHCGRNRYIIQPPANTNQLARVLFDTQRSQCILQASPLAAFLRVPLQWYYSTTFALYPDETSAMIHRVYTPHDEAHTMRHFCGFCGTPLSYWSEEPRSEADFINLTLGSLAQEDLRDLEDMGLVPTDDEPSRPVTPPTEQDTQMAGTEGEAAVVESKPKTRETVGGLPWFDTLTEGSKLGKLRLTRSSGSGTSRDGRINVEWEVVEWTEDDDSHSQGSRNSKRKLAEEGETYGEPRRKERAVQE